MIINNCGVFSNVGLISLTFKGYNGLSAGYVWAPYIPLTLENAVMCDDIDVIASRYAIKIIKNSYYGTMTIQKNRGGFTHEYN